MDTRVHRGYNRSFQSSSATGWGAYPCGARVGNLSSVHISMKNVLLSLLDLVVVQPTHDQLIAWTTMMMMMMTMMISRCDFSSFVAQLMSFCAFRLMLFCVFRLMLFYAFRVMLFMFSSLCYLCFRTYAFYFWNLCYLCIRVLYSRLMF